MTERITINLREDWDLDVIEEQRKRHLKREAYQKFAFGDIVRMIF